MGRGNPRPSRSAVNRNIACGKYGIDQMLFRSVCPNVPNVSKSEDFARLFITGVQTHVSAQDAKLENYKERLIMYREQLKMKDDMIELLKQQSQVKPSAPPAPMDEGETI
jgi:hypothetical protein